MSGDRPSLLHGHSQQIFDALKAAGVIQGNDYVRRVVIDIHVDRAVTVYVERYGDERLLDVVLPVVGAVITESPAAEQEIAR